MSSIIEYVKSEKRVKMGWLAGGGRNKWVLRNDDDSMIDDE